MCKICLNSEHKNLLESYQKLELQLGYKELELKRMTELETKTAQGITNLEEQLAKSAQTIANLETNLASLLEEETLLPAGTIDVYLMSSILLDKLEEMGDDKAELYLADKNCKVFKKEDVVKFLDLDETDKIVYVAEEQDCDDFASALYAEGLGLVWTTKHALCFFVDETNILWFVEPQSDKIARDLEDWQGWDCRMFLSR